MKNIKRFSILEPLSKELVDSITNIEVFLYQENKDGQLMSETYKNKKDSENSCDFKN